MKKTALVIMAAGIGSRFGKGIKQLTPVGANGEIIMDYSIHDAMEAGFDKVVFIIRKSLEEEFREIIGNRIEKKVETVYAFQELNDLPKGFTLPEGRTKPWGTAHAVLCAKEYLTEPFAVINADDYYGKQAYRLLHEELIRQEDRTQDGKLNICMAGFRLKNTLSDHGSVTRGLCHIQDGKLTGVTETWDIYRTPDGAETRSKDGVKPLDPEGLVSMNMWGLTPAFADRLENSFIGFLEALKPGDIRTEYLLPELIDRMIRANTLQVNVLESSDEWFGMTYQEDVEAVREALAKLTAKGEYPQSLR